MFNKEDILSAILSGQDPEEIAKNFADTLNDAIATKQAEDAAAAAKIAKKTAKIAKLREATATVTDFVKEYYPEVAKYMEVFAAASDDELLSAIDDFMSQFSLLANLTNLDRFIATESKKPEIKPEKQVDPIEEFLKKYSLI